jgi:hypothetical protein
VTRMPTDAEQARSEARVECLPAELNPGEEAAFDLVVQRAGAPSILLGRWSRSPDGSQVKWPDGSQAETGPCDDDPAKVIEAIRPTIPVFKRPERRRPRAAIKGILGRLPGRG